MAVLGKNKINVWSVELAISLSMVSVCCRLATARIIQQTDSALVVRLGINWLVVSVILLLALTTVYL